MRVIHRPWLGEQGHRRRQLATVGGHAHRMVRAVNKLREEFAKPLRIGDVAKEIGMSVSGFHGMIRESGVTTSSD